LKEVQPAHQGSLEEVHDRVIADLKHEQAIQMAKHKSEELVQRVKGGVKFENAAKDLGLDPKTSDSIARDGSISGAASGKQLSAAFNLKQGDVGAPLNLGQNWLVYRVAEKVEADPANFEAQKKQLAEELLQTKRDMAYEAFRTSLTDRLKQEGKLKIMPEKLKGFGSLV
jgi:peptidyl-prolyl cis-trans isomerase D